MSIKLICAISKNNVIGNKNELPWNISEDLKRFKELTSENIIVMGRKTFESIGRPLPNRTNIIVSNTLNEVAGCYVCNSLKDAVSLGKEHTNDEVILIGGAKIFEEGMKIINKLVISWVDADQLKGDVYFPNFDMNDWVEVSSDTYQKSDSNEYSFKISEYIKR